ncbi:MAG TPA: hypothetical protein V6C76_11835 [Drouetiella sp.]
MTPLRLNDAQIRLIFTKKPVFQHAQNVTGVPWQAIASIWFRESSLQERVGRIGGPFQFDPPLNAKQMTNLLEQFTHLDNATRQDLIKKGINDFASAAIFCACWLRKSSRYPINPSASDEAIKDCFYGYNGRKYKSVDESAYVMNGYDLQHEHLHIKGTLPDHGKRIYIDKEDPRPGAFTVYKQLKALDSK